MEFVHPIKEIDQINQIKQLLFHHSKRDYVFFTVGINTGLRLNDLLHLKVSHVWDGQQMKDFIFLRDTDPPYYLNHNIKNATKSYLECNNLQMDHYLFKSQKSELPITRQQAYRIINHAAKEIGITENVGTHTLRKTFGYHAYKKGVAISLLQKILHHSSTLETLEYLGIEKEEDTLIQIDVNL
ncbi:Phage integrase family protein [Gracilibacillus ureilyticus]|uniref:Phage integrase family protein n=1 Tax=Gracilibacillus ureilyticus TaxID=531814 RepID=A0A1H9NCW5_9BACI|nr:tyrosine-type recombinase/integrase [Gracilibacillus ureilyticus]SER33794.1 Phage integrase family protein [Gracilibacillus ureilyticus]